jgi:hypothetical protein
MRRDEAFEVTVLEPRELTLRDYFAGIALAEVVRKTGSRNRASDNNQRAKESQAKQCYEWADAMISARWNE